MTHKTKWKSSQGTEKVPFQLVATLGYMFSLVWPAVLKAKGKEKERGGEEREDVIGCSS